MLLWRPARQVRRMARTGRITPMQAQYLVRKGHRMVVNSHRHALHRAREAERRTANGTPITNPNVFEELR